MRAVFLCLRLCLCLAAAGCVDDPVVADTGPPDAPVPDLAVGDRGLDVAAEASPPDAPACKRLGGAYSVSSGSCSVSGFSPPAHLCVWQPQGCTATLYAEGRDAQQGTVKDDTLQTSSTTMSCTLKGSALSCKDSYKGVSCSGTLTAASITGASATCCDPLAQTCPKAVQERCVVTTYQQGGDNYAVSACIPDSGDKLKGQSCQRSGGVGFDDCRRGLWCTTWAVAPAGTRRCRRMCASAKDCAAGQGCRLIAGTYASAPRTGACIPSCDPLGTSGGGCGTGLACHLTLDIDKSATGISKLGGYCYPEGSKQLGEICSNRGDCAATLQCFKGACRELCSLNKPVCSVTGQSCTTFSNPLAGALAVGYCL